MKVSELITILQSRDPDADVVVDGYEGGYCDVGEAKLISLLCDVHTEWYYGPHEDDTEWARSYYKGRWSTTKQAVLIA